jgi:hypothetical protein
MVSDEMVEDNDKQTSIIMVIMVMVTGMGIMRMHDAGQVQ